MANEPNGLYAWDIDHNDWAYLGDLTGPKGDKGDTGDTGPAGAAGVTPNISAAATVGTGTGTPSVSVVKTGTAAAPTFTFNFNNLKGATGPQGAAGATGATGPQGPAGPKGDTGDTGPQGPTGATGPAGQDGTDGVDGQRPVISAAATICTGTGTPTVTVTKSGTDLAPTLTFAFDNLKGPKGDNGTTGATGATGATGPQGPQGEQGEQGIQGPTGATGPTGTKGDKGDKGDTGARGPQGERGATGYGVPAGGTANQMLVKNSSSNYDTKWVNQPDSSHFSKYTVTGISSSTSTSDFSVYSSSVIGKTIKNVRVTVHWDTVPNGYSGIIEAGKRYPLNGFTNGDYVFSYKWSQSGGDVTITSVAPSKLSVITTPTGSIVAMTIGDNVTPIAVPGGVNADIILEY